MTTFTGFRRRLRCCAALLSMLMLNTAHGDGAFEISALCVPTGCFGGDDPGFPVELAQAGRYRLTSNLSVDQDTTAIDIAAAGVDLDLNGFAVLGPTECAGSSCTGTGTGFGILVSAAGPGSFAVRNGTIRGMGGDCIQAAVHLGKIRDVMVESCGRTGIELAGGLIRNVTVLGAGDDGIVSSNLAMVRDSWIGFAAGRGQSGGFCGNNVYAMNGLGQLCTAVGPNAP